MAKIERKKVSREALKNKAKTKWWTKTKIIIASIVAFIAVACAVTGTVLHFVLADDEDTSYDYFVTASNSEGNEVTFTKASYRGLQMVIDDTTNLFEEYVIVFMYDSTRFYPSETDDEDNYNRIHSEILLKMANLQTEVNKAKENDIDISLYVVDLNVGENSSIMSDSDFLGDSAYSEDTTSFECSIAVVENGDSKSTFDYTSGTKKISAVSDDEVYNTALVNLVLYVQNTYTTTTTN